MAVHYNGNYTKKRTHQKATQSEVTKTSVYNKKIFHSTASIREAVPQLLQRAGGVSKAFQRVKSLHSAVEVFSLFRSETARRLFLIVPSVDCPCLIGMRKLREVDLYREDPMVKRVLGVEALPSVSTMSRLLDQCDDRSVSGLQELEFP